MCLLPRAFIRSASSWSSSSCCISSIGSSPSTFSSFSAGGSIAIGIAPRPFLGLTSSILDSFLLGSCDNRSLGLSFAGYLSYSNESKVQLFNRNRCRVSCGGRSNDRSETSENSPTFPSMCLQSTHTIDHFLGVFSYSSQSLTEFQACTNFRDRWMACLARQLQIIPPIYRRLNRLSRIILSARSEYDGSTLYSAMLLVLYYNNLIQC